MKDKRWDSASGMATWGTFTEVNDTAEEQNSRETEFDFEPW